MRIKEIVLKTTMDVERNLGSLEVFVEADRENCEQQKKVFLWAQLTDEQQEEVDRIFPMELEEQTQFCMEVSCPKLWNTEYPCHYELILELRDEENRLLGCTSKLTGFYHTSIEDGKLLLNGQPMSWRRAEVNELSKQSFKEQLSVREYLKKLRAQFYNCLYVPEEWSVYPIGELCVEYGILLLDKEKQALCETAAGIKEHPDFEVQVVEEGVLIENKSYFINTNVYSLRCEIRSEDRVVQQSVVEADVPAGSSRYLELPFIKPQRPGLYRYRVSLCLKKDVPWGTKGETVAAGETLISNLWLG